MPADVSGLEQLAVQLGQAAATTMRDVQQVVAKGALNIKRDWRANAVQSAASHGRLYPYTIGYDTTVRATSIEAVIGPDRDKKKLQGTFGDILEFGSVHNPPHNDGGRALDAEEPRFVAALEQFGEVHLL